VTTWPEHNGDVYNPSLPVAAVEQLAGARDFDAPPGRSAVDAAGRGFGRGGGGFLRLPAARHLRFQSQHGNPERLANEIIPFNPKHVVLEVFGPPGTVATINYHR
jgi:Mycobacterium membrane protein